MGMERNEHMLMALLMHVGTRVSLPSNLISTCLIWGNLKARGWRGKPARPPKPKAPVPRLVEAEGSMPLVSLTCISCAGGHLPQPQRHRSRPAFA